MSYSPEVLADSPLLYWMDAGGTDSSGNGRDATAGVNGTSVSGLLSSDPTSPAVQFDGSSQYLREAYGSWMAVSSLTIEVWVKTSQATQALIVSRDNGFVDRIWGLGHSLSGSAGKPYLVRLKNPGGSLTAEVAQGTTSINDGNAHHLVGTYDGTNLRLYVDGNLEATTAAAGGLYAAPALLDVASVDGGRLLPYGGVLDEIAYYGSALSGARIAAHYTAGSSGSPDATVAPPAATATAAAVVPVVSASSSVSPVAATATASAPVPMVTNGSNATVSAPAATATASAPPPVITQVIPAGTDTSNFLYGRNRRARGSVTVVRPAAAVPSRAAVKYDKSVPLPPPTLVNGRPT